VHPRTPPIVADFSRLIQILYNLTGNSLKFTHDGHVTITARPTEHADTVELQVKDTGIGIPAERLDYIWDAFEQVRFGQGRAGARRTLHGRCTLAAPCFSCPGATSSAAYLRLGVCFPGRCVR
jgi:signal transduction histidine kinase